MELSDEQIVERVLEQKLRPGDANGLVKANLGRELMLLQDPTMASLSHREACRALVALYGLQILRERGVRTAIVAGAHADQVRALHFADEQFSPIVYSTIDDMRRTVADHPWHAGSRWARDFCQAFALPPFLAGRESDAGTPPYHEVQPFVPVPPLHDFQEELRGRIEAVIGGQPPRRGLVALPTGAGKTRLLVDTALGLEDVRKGRRPVVWIAQHDELCEQAVRCFAQVWGSPEIGASRVLSIQRVWKSLNDRIDWNSDVIIGTPESLVPRLRKASAEERERVVLAIVDEAHHALAASYQALFSLLGSSTIIGITATPGSSLKGKSHALRKRFGGLLLTANLLDPDPVAELQRRGILAMASYETAKTNFRVDSEIIDTDAIEQFGDLPQKLLNKLGDSVSRNRVILQRLLDVPRNAGESVLCFATSVASSRALAAALVIEGRSARSIDATTDRWNRAEAVEAFKARKLQFLVNYGVLTTGFDAPKVNTLVLARPTTSPILFEQMLGRGLRGPKNGGTEYCHVIYFEDDFTGFGGVRPLSYRRFLED